MNGYQHGHRPRHGAAADTKQPEGCLTAAVRLPVRIVMFVLVLPVRMVWDGLVLVGRALRRGVLVPAGRALAWLWRTLVVAPASSLWRTVLAPVCRGVGIALVWTGKALFVWPWVALWRYVVAPETRNRG